MSHCRILALCLLSSFALAKSASIQLYEHPDDQAKKIASMEIEQSLTIVHDPWLKVYDPKTKKIGWIKEADLGNIITYPLRIDRRVIGDQAHPYQIIEYRTTSNQLSEEAIDKLIKQHQAMAEDMFKDIARSLKTFESMSNETEKPLRIQILDNKEIPH